MEIVGTTWGNVSRLWLAMFWRSFVFGLISGFALGFIFGFLNAILRLHLPPLGGVIGLIGGIPVSIWALKLALSRRYSGFVIQFVKTP